MRALARALERGLPDWAPLRSLETAWVHFARIARPLRIPAGLRVITVGGATLGGSGKTPLSVAIAKHVSSLGVRVALVSHAYRASSTRSRWVFPDDDHTAIGDESQTSALALASTNARVVSGKSRQASVDLANEWAEWIVIDGPLQLRPQRADWSVLAVDADAPWGSGACPPRGDLRATPEVLVAHADTVICIKTDGSPPRGDEASWQITGARMTKTGEAMSLAEVRARPAHLVTNIARPQRLVRCLRAHGIDVTHHVDLMDHSRANVRLANDCFCLAPTKTRQAADWSNSAWIDAHLVLAAQIESAIALSIKPRSATSGVP